MRGALVKILLALGVQTRGHEGIALDADRSLGELVDGLLDNLIDRVHHIRPDDQGPSLFSHSDVRWPFQPSHVHWPFQPSSSDNQRRSSQRQSLDSTTIGKQGQLAAPGRSTGRVLPALRHPPVISNGNPAAPLSASADAHAVWAPARSYQPAMRVQAHAQHRPKTSACAVATEKEARERAEAAERALASPEVQREIYRATALAQSRDMQEKVKALRQDPKLKHVIDDVAREGTAAALKHHNDPAFLGALAERLGAVPVLSTEEAEQLEATIAHSETHQSEMRALRDDPEFKPMFDDIETLGSAAVTKYLDDPAFLHTVGEHMGENTALRAEANELAAAVAEAEVTQEKMMLLRKDPEFKAVFDEMEEGGASAVQKHLGDLSFLRKVGERLGDTLTTTAVSNSTAIAKGPFDSGRVEGSVLVLVMTFLWSSNFPAVKAVLDAGLPGSIQAASRFSIAAIALLPLLVGKGPLPPDFVRGSIETGVLIAVGYIGQALALHELPAGAVAFLCSLQVVAVPLMQSLRGKAQFTPRLAMASGMCVCGVGLLEAAGMGGASGDAMATAGSSSFLFASVLALLQPLGFGSSYVRIEGLMKKYPEFGPQLSSIQLLSNAAVALTWFAVDAAVKAGDAGGAGFDMTALQQPAVLASLFYTGLVSTALTVPIQMRAQKKLPAADFAVIVATEPLWATGFAALLLHEQPSSFTLFGGGVIVLACIANTVLPTDLGFGTSDSALKNGDSQKQYAQLRGRLDRLNTRILGD